MLLNQDALVVLGYHVSTPDKKLAIVLVVGQDPASPLNEHRDEEHDQNGDGEQAEWTVDDNFRQTVRLTQFHNILLLFTELVCHNLCIFRLFIFWTFVGDS